MRSLHRVGVLMLLSSIIIGTSLAFVAVGKKISSSEDTESETAPQGGEAVLSVGANVGSATPEETLTEENIDTPMSPVEMVPSLVTPAETALPKPEGIVDDTVAEDPPYPLHQDVTTTLFWVGEEAGDDNKDISNLPSAWDEKWVKHFGGVDDPDKRNGNFPAKFTPQENPFYFALPYNDFDSKGKRKKDAASIIPWAKDRTWKDDESMLKNRWIEVTKGEKTCYAQWQDVGPFKENDSAYVFGTATPESKTNKHAGLDLSPAASQCLGLKDIDIVDWRFVVADAVPDGPWKEIVTTSQVYWK